MSEETQETAKQQTETAGFRFTSSMMKAVWRYAKNAGYKNMKDFWEGMKEIEYTFYDVLEAESP